MKYNKIITISTLLLLAFNVNAKPHESKQHISEKYEFSHDSSDNLLYVHNVNGFVEIEGYDGTEVLIELDKTISANSKSNLQLGLDETSFQVVIHENQIHMYLKTPHTYLKFDKGKVNFRMNHQHSTYNFNMNYKIKVPKYTNLNISTVNSGHIKINNIQTNIIKANNINGKISLTKVSGIMHLKTVNGDVALSYLNQDIQPSIFESVNGTFDISLVDQANLDISYETLNGSFYTYLDTVDVSAVVKKEIHKKQRGIKYKFIPSKNIKIGTGDIKFSFKTINGDINITKKA